MEDKKFKAVNEGTTFPWAVKLLTCGFALMLFLLFFNPIVVVGAGQRGVLMNFGAVQPVIFEEGLHFIMPIYQQVQIMEIRTQIYEASASAATRDLLDVQTKVAVNYRISGKEVNTIFQTIGMSYEERIIAPAVQEVVKATTAEFEAGMLITERPLVKQKIEEQLRTRLVARGVIVEAISLTDFTFPVVFNDAITAKQTAIQLKFKAQNDLERIKVEAEQAIAQAKGQSESIRIINEQLEKSPKYVELLAVQKWDGKLPLATSGLPFLQLPMSDKNSG